MSHPLLNMFVAMQVSLTLQGMMGPSSISKVSLLALQSILKQIVPVKIFIIIMLLLHGAGTGGSSCGAHSIHSCDAVSCRIFKEQ